MKHLLLFSAALMMGTTAFAQTPAPAQLAGAPQHLLKTLTAKKAPKRSADNQGTKWLPVKETEYEYMDGEWEAGSVYTYIYDKNGYIARQDEEYDGTINRTDNEWTSYGYNTLQVTSSSEDGTTFVNSEKRVQVYDELVPWLCIQKDKYVWQDDAWTAITDAYKRTVTRDADGNVVSVVVSVPYDGAYDDMQRLTNIVDPETKQIVASKSEKLGYNADNTVLEWKTDAELTDIKWVTTNGQIVEAFGDHDYYSDSDNLLASYKDVTNNIQYTATYDGQGGCTCIGTGTGYYAKVTQTMGENGSYTMLAFFQIDSNGDGVLTDDDTQGWAKTVAEYDAYGNLTLEEISESEDGKMWKVVIGTKQEITYDTEHAGAVRETIYSSYDTETGAYVPFIKVVTDELTEVANGILTVSSDESTTARIYNLQGVAQNADLGSLPAGVYVVKTARQTVKVIKR